MKSLGLLVVLMGVVGCSSASSPKAVPLTITPPPSQDFSISPPTSDEVEPFYRVVVTRPLSEKRVLKIWAQSRPLYATEFADIGDAVVFTDMLQQKDGSDILFDCAHIADKIIDAKLVAEITPYCVQGHALGWKYWKQRNYVPDSYVDSYGTKWVRVK